MCKHKFKEAHPIIVEKHCDIHTYFEKWKDAKTYFQSIGKVIPKHIEILDDTLPLDDNEICIFHTPNIEWKKMHDYENRFQQFLLILEYLSQINALIDVDLRDVHLLGIHYEQPEKRKKREELNKRIGEEFFKKPKAIPFVNLTFHRALRLENATFYDVFIIKNASTGFIDLRYCTFKKQVTIAFSQIAQINFNFSKLLEGIKMEEVLYATYMEFEHCYVHKLFEFSGIVFNEPVIFDKTQFDIEEIFSIEFYCIFKGRVSFNDVKFNGITVFKNCTFEQEVSFNNCRFKKRFFFEYNEIHNNLNFSAKNNLIPVFNDTADFKIDETKLKGKIILR